MGDDTLMSAEIYFSDYLNVANAALDRFGEFLPRNEVDVGEKVYVRLGGEEIDRYDNDATRPLDEHIAALHEMAKGAKGAEVIIKFSASGYDDEYSAEYELGYWRDPTKKERAEREALNVKIRARNAAQAEQAEAAEREKYERLKAKYGA